MIGGAADGGTEGMASDAVVPTGARLLVAIPMGRGGSGAPFGRETGCMRDWSVAGGLILREDRLLLVANRRRDGRIEWTPPGGVVDFGETSLEALGREVREETGLEVTSWSDLVYGVSVDFPDREMRLGVEVFRAERWSGDLTFEDPDGIVEDGVFVDGEEGSVLLESAPRWVWEPVGDWLAGRVPDGACYDFLARGTSPGNLDVERR